MGLWTCPACGQKFNASFMHRPNKAPGCLNAQLDTAMRAQGLILRVEATGAFSSTRVALLERLKLLHYARDAARHTKFRIYVPTWLQAVFKTLDSGAGAHGELKAAEATILERMSADPELQEAFDALCLLDDNASSRMARGAEALLQIAGIEVSDVGAADPPDDDDLEGLFA